MTEEEQQYFDDLATEYGSCPNCGASNIHISELGEEGGIVCCKFCCLEERDKIRNNQLEKQDERKV